MQRIYKIACLILTGVCLLTNAGFSQESGRPSLSLRDRQRKKMHTRDSLIRSLNKSDTSVNTLLNRLGQYDASFNQLANDMANGIDTADVSTGYPSALRRLTRVKALANTHKSSTLRYLFVLRDNLDHLQGSLEDWQTSLDDIASKLVQHQTDLIKFSKDSILKASPNDSLLKARFFARRKNLLQRWNHLDSVNRNALFKVNVLQDKVGTVYADMLDETDHIDTKIKKFALRALTGDFGYVWQVDSEYNDFKEALMSTITLNNTLLYYFFKNETVTHLTAFIFLVLVFGWLLYNRAKTKRRQADADTIFEQAPFIDKLPIVSCLLVVTAITPYFYDHPPVIFLEGVFFVSIILALIIVKRFYHITLFNSLLALFGLAIAFGVSNLLIEVTNVDRYTILVLSALAAFIGWKFYKKVKAEPEENLPNTGIALIIFMALQALSLLCDITGRFSVAKIIGVTAVYNLWFLVTLYLVVKIILQGLFLQFQSRNTESNLLSLLDYTLVESKFRKFLRICAALLWLFFLFQNLNIDDAATDYLTNLLGESRTVAGASFTVGGFVIFIGVIWLSSILSRIVSYFYDVSAQRSTLLDSLKKKNRTSTLLIRIGVFTVGFFLAIAASNFPLDKITIIISAFGIGIGFGLQNIVNNLVSGLILAFEKPIQIGDVIEVDTRSGSVKEIGIRSSKLATGDGAEVIIPNADLISHHVINWTLSNNNRRVEIIISVAHGSDIEKVKTMLSKLLSDRDDIMTSPEPLVFFHNLTPASIDFRLLFWAADISTWLRLKSNVLTDLYASLTEQGIALPQTDVNIHLADEQSIRVLNDSESSKKLPISSK